MALNIAVLPGDGIGPEIIAQALRVLEVLKNDGISIDRRHTMIETQLRASHRMNAMLTEILEFSRGSYKLSPKTQPLAPIIGRATQEVGALVMDEAIYDDLQELLRDLKHNPWKFFWKE